MGKSEIRQEADLALQADVALNSDMSDAEVLERADMIIQSAYKTLQDADMTIQAVETAVLPGMPLPFDKAKECVELYVRIVELNENAVVPCIIRVDHAWQRILSRPSTGVRLEARHAEPHGVADVNFSELALLEFLCDLALEGVAMPRTRGGIEFRYSRFNPEAEAEMFVAV